LDSAIVDIVNSERSTGLNVGYIPYLNCVPFFHHLAGNGFHGTIVPGVPSALNTMLQRGDIDISPSSSFEYALNSENYLLLPKYSISSCGPVESVLLFAPCSLNGLQSRKIAVTGESATSINLLRVLLREYVGLTRVEDYVPTDNVEDLIAQGQPALLIGDRAIKQASSCPDGMYCYDLGGLWYEFTGLPFVFALWILQRKVGVHQACDVEDLQRALEASISQAFSDLPLLATAIGKTGDEMIAAVKYWQTIDYSLTPSHLSGLELFYRLCQKYEYLNKLPPIEFFRG